MEMHQIKVFIVLSEELHFGRAAERLGMAQPPLSRLIRQLEEDLGVSLFNRTTRQVQLSDAGRALVEPAKRMLELERTALDSVRRAETGEYGVVNFGFSRSSTRDLAADLVAASTEVNPGVSFVLESSIYADEAVSRLIDGSLDLALVRWRSRPPQITGRPVLIEHPAVTVPEGHRLANRKFVKVEELAEDDFVSMPSHPNSSLRETMIRLCHQAGFSPRIVQEGPDSQTIRALIRAGMGITITYDSVAKANPEIGTVTLPLDLPDESMMVYLAYRDDHCSAALTSVLEIAEEVFVGVEPSHG